MMVFLRPFKVFVTFAKEIRELLDSLEKLHAAAEGQEGHDVASADKLKDTEDATALAHLRLLVQFIDEDLADIVNVGEAMMKTT